MWGDSQDSLHIVKQKERRKKVNGKNLFAFRKFVPENGKIPSSFGGASCEPVTKSSRRHRAVFENYFFPL